MTNNLTDEEIASLGAGFEVGSFEDIWRAIGRLPFMAQDGPYAWRGVPDSGFRIQSSLYRLLQRHHDDKDISEDLMRSVEVSLIELAREWGIDGTSAGRVNDLQLLATMQHHGAPTRLLDVTANPLTALYFACAAEPSKDGLLMALNLSGYDAFTSEDGVPTWNSLKSPMSHRLQQVLDISASSKLPFVLRSARPDSRMAVQEGFFLASACPSPPEPLEYREVPRPMLDGMYLGPSSYIPQGMAKSMLFDQDPEFVSYPQAMWSFKIPAGLKRGVLNSLDKNFNRRASVLFPDIAGFSEVVRMR